MVLVLEGVLRFTEGGKRVSVCKNHYYIQKANLPQSADEPSDCPVYFYIHFTGCVEDREDGLPIEGTFDPALMLPIFKEVERVCRDPARSHFEKRFVFYKLLSALDSSQKKLMTAQQELAQKLHEIILEEYAQPFSVDEVSDRLRYSKNYLIDVFHAQYGTTPYKYVNLLRLEKGRQLLLTTDKSCQEISDECGFSEYSLFYKLFRAQYEMSPQLYKKSMCCNHSSYAKEDADKQ
jgi:AraC-like DNA-binding protein